MEGKKIKIHQYFNEYIANGDKKYFDMNRMWKDMFKAKYDY